MCRAHCPFFLLQNWVQGRRFITSGSLRAVFVPSTNNMNRNISFQELAVVLRVGGSRILGYPREALRVSRLSLMSGPSKRRGVGVICPRSCYPTAQIYAALARSRARVGKGGQLFWSVKSKYAVASGPIANSHPPQSFIVLFRGAWVDTVARHFTGSSCIYAEGCAVLGLHFERIHKYFILFAPQKVLIFWSIRVIPQCDASCGRHIIGHLEFCGEAIQ